jgi:hypothetical protein
MRLRWIPIRLLILLSALGLLGLVVVAGAIGDALDGGSGSAGRQGQPSPGLEPPSSIERPIGHYTPGTTAPGIGLADLCPHLSDAWDDARRSLPDGTKLRYKALYGIPSETRIVQWDHLVPRSLAGADTVSNIWPRVNRAQTLRKDRLANRLHGQVCRGELSLPVAQQRARTFWEWW